MEKFIRILTPILAIIVLGALEAFALSRGIDGTLFAGVSLIIGGLAGYTGKDVVSKLKRK